MPVFTANPTDEELVARALKVRRLRKVTGLVSVLTGLLFMTSGWSVGSWMTTKADKVVRGWEDSMGVAREWVQDDIADGGASHSAIIEAANFRAGLSLGVYIGALMVSGLILMATGVRLLWVPNRERDLMIRLWNTTPSARESVLRPDGKPGEGSA